MRLDRNTRPDGKGKYAIINLRKLDMIMAACPNDSIKEAVDTLQRAGAISYGTAPNEGFFVLKYKDIFAEPALEAYRYAVLKRAQWRGAHGFADLRDTPEQQYSLGDYVGDLTEELSRVQATKERKLPD